MSHWLYKGEVFTEPQEEHFGFVYLIKNIQTGRKYIGRKYFGTTRRIKVKGKTRRKVIRKESDWATYTGSSKSLQQDINLLGIAAFEFTILILGETKGQVNYLEENIHHRFHVSASDDFYNDCIGPRRFAKVRFDESVAKRVNNIVV